METKQELTSVEWTEKLSQIQKCIAEKILGVLVVMDCEAGYDDSVVDQTDPKLIREVNRCYWLLQESWRTAQHLRRHILDYPLRNAAREEQVAADEPPTLPTAKVKFFPDRNDMSSDHRQVIVGINHIADITRAKVFAEQSRPCWYVEWAVDAGLAETEGQGGFESVEFAEEYVKQTVPKILAKFYDEN
jgi:hypothetical protein